MQNSFTQVRLVQFSQSKHLRTCSHVIHFTTCVGNLTEWREMVGARSGSSTNAVKNIVITLWTETRLPGRKTSLLLACLGIKVCVFGAATSYH